MGDGEHISSSIFNQNLPDGSLFVSRGVGKNNRILREESFNPHSSLDIERSTYGHLPQHALASSGSIRLTCLPETEIEEPIRFSDSFFTSTKKQKYIVTSGNLFVPPSDIGNRKADAFVNYNIRRFDKQYAGYPLYKLPAIAVKEELEIYLSIIKHLLNFYPPLQKEKNQKFVSVVSQNSTEKMKLSLKKDDLIQEIITIMSVLVQAEASRGYKVNLKFTDMRKLLDSLKFNLSEENYPVSFFSISELYFLWLITDNSETAKKLETEMDIRENMITHGNLPSNLNIAKDEIIKVEDTRYFYDVISDPDFLIKSIKNNDVATMERIKEGFKNYSKSVKNTILTVMQNTYLDTKGVMKTILSDIFIAAADMINAEEEEKYVDFSN